MPRTEEKVMCPVCDEYTIPRPLVAISEDRQWLVARVSSVGMFRAFGFGIFKFDGRDYVWQESVLGTGQSADQVLRKFLAGREG